MGRYTFSVIVTVFNRELQIIDALISLNAQVFRDFEILIVDDCSSDNSVAVIQNFLAKNPNLHARLIRRTENGGQNAAINSAAEYISGDYVAFLDSDDLWEESFLLEFNDHIRSLDTTQFSFHYCRLVDGPKWFLEGINQFENVLRQGYLSALGTLVIKKESFQVVLPLPERFFVNDMCQDDFICFELARKFNFTHLPKELYRINGVGEQRTTVSNNNFIRGWSQFYEYYKNEISSTLGSTCYWDHISRVHTELLWRGDYRLWAEMNIQQSRKMDFSDLLIYFFTSVRAVIKMIISRFAQRFG
jgi:glycosyltransferase involved in cell wall biosynthesis